MLQNDPDRGYAGDRKIPPEQWEAFKQAAVKRARQEQAEALRHTVQWAATLPFVLGRRLAKAFAAWRRRRDAIFQLHSLDNRSLRDLGINRSEIESVVRGWDATRIPRGESYRAPRAAQRGVARRATPPTTKQAA